MAIVLTIANKKLFPADASTGMRRVTLADLEEISDFIVSLSGAPAVWLKVEKTFADFAAAATTNDIEIYELPAGARIETIIIKHSTAFAGGSLTSYTISAGIVGTLNKYASALDVFQAVAGNVFEDGDVRGMESFTAATSIRAAATGSHDLDTATAGAVTFYLLVSSLPGFEE